MPVGGRWESRGKEGAGWGSRCDRGGRALPTMKTRSGAQTADASKDRRRSCFDSENRTAVFSSKLASHL